MLWSPFTTEVQLLNDLKLQEGEDEVEVKVEENYEL